jgi:probable DNA metabolism protein
LIKQTGGIVQEMRRRLNELFSLLANNDKVRSQTENDLFTLTAEMPVSALDCEQEDIDLLSAYFNSPFNLSDFNEPARKLFQVSQDAFDVFIHAWMSELPVEKQIVSYGRKVMAAKQAADDCGDEDTFTVKNAAGKVRLEVHRITGFLRFSPQNDIYTAHCAPDHLIIPALGAQFTARFHKISWAVIDDKRKLCLYSMMGEKAKLIRQEKTAEIPRKTDEWEELWRHYHKTINNESRKNTGLQRQFMPNRYRKYLPEL